MGENRITLNYMNVWNEGKKPRGLLEEESCTYERHGKKEYEKKERIQQNKTRK